MLAKTIIYPTFAYVSYLVDVDDCPTHFKKFLLFSDVFTSFGRRKRSAPSVSVRSRINATNNQKMFVVDGTDLLQHFSGYPWPWMVVSIIENSVSPAREIRFWKRHK